MHAISIKKDNGTKPMPFQIKKRVNQFENEVIKIEKKPIHIPNSYGDRFIPRRYTNLDKNRYLFNQISVNQHININNNNNNNNINTNIINNSNYNNDNNDNIIRDILDITKTSNYWRIEAFKRCIDYHFNISKSNRVLVFHDTMTQEMCQRTLNRAPFKIELEKQFKNEYNLDWQCYPRQKPLAFADSTHDLPGFHRFSYLNVIAWSKTGKMAASFGLDLVIWMPHLDSTVVYKIKGIRSLSYNRTGTHLAIGSKKGCFNCLHIWNVEKDGISVLNCHYYNFMKEEVRCIEWDTDEKFIICGMLNGSIYVHYYPSLRLKKILNEHVEGITSIKFSSNQTLMGTVDVCGKLVIWSMKTLEIDFVWQSTNSCPVYIAWHPWKEFDMIIATTFPGTINLMNVKKRKIESYYRRTDRKCLIDGITFNSLSGELVVSCFIQDNGVRKSEILIMSSINNVVDVLTGHDNRVRFLMWNPDNTQLATAGDDETLHIWNFFASPKMIQYYLGKQKQKQNNAKNINNKNGANRFYASKLTLFGSFLNSR